MPLFSRLARFACPGILAGSVAVACLAAQNQQAPPQSQQAQAVPDPQTGANLFVSSGCAQCHGPEGNGTTKAPSIHDVRKRKTDAEIYTQIKEGKGAMPPFGDALQEEEMRSIVLFLRTPDGWKLMSSAR